MSLSQIESDTTRTVYTMVQQEHPQKLVIHTMIAWVEHSNERKNRHD
jgi:hypothetical protein